MISVGATAKRTRESAGLSQRAAADLLGISNVHLCNIENDKALPSPTLLAAFRKHFGVDLYVLAWCEQGDIESLPAAVRKAAKQLHKVWSKEVANQGYG